MAVYSSPSQVGHLVEYQGTLDTGLYMGTDHSFHNVGVPMAAPISKGVPL